MERNDPIVAERTEEQAIDASVEHAKVLEMYKAAKNTYSEASNSLRLKLTERAEVLRRQARDLLALDLGNATTKQQDLVLQRMGEAHAAEVAPFDRKFANAL